MMWYVVHKLSNVTFIIVEEICPCGMFMRHIIYNVACLYNILYIMWHIHVACLCDISYIMWHVHTTYHTWFGMSMWHVIHDVVCHVVCHIWCCMPCDMPYMIACHMVWHVWCGIWCKNYPMWHLLLLAWHVHVACHSWLYFYTSMQN